MKKPDTTQRLDEALSDVSLDEKDALRAMWHLSESADDVPNISHEQVDTLWKQLEAVADRQSHPFISKSLKQDRRLKRRFYQKPVSRVWAGMAVIVLLAAIGVSYLLTPVVKMAPYGEQISAHLPDGSVIELNSGSSIRYPRIFVRNRTVSLQGEAYFDVNESDIPFVVQTFNVELSVLGTTFNIKAWEGGGSSKSVISLTSGSVRLSPTQNPGQSIVMTPGQTVVVEQGSDEFIQYEYDNIDHVLAWRKGDLVFKDQKLVYVLEEIERRFGIDVELRSSQLSEKEVTFAYRQALSAESILEDLCHALDLQYRPILNGYELFE